MPEKQSSIENIDLETPASRKLKTVVAAAQEPVPEPGAEPGPEPGAGPETGPEPVPESGPEHEPGSATGAGLATGAGAVTGAVPGRLHSGNRAEAEKLLKELPEAEFLDLLEKSSPEQLQAFLDKLAPTRQPLAQALKGLFAKAVEIPDEPRGSLSIVAWWESRRILFNLIVGVCGLPTLAIVYLTGLVSSFGFLFWGTIEYGLLANVCFTAGWICELIARSWWQERAKFLGPILFSLGMIFSVLLTLGSGLGVMILLFLINILKAIV